MNLKKSSFEIFLFKNIYWIILMTFLLSMFTNVERILINGIIIFIVDFWILRRKKFRFNSIEVACVWFLLYCLITFGPYIFNGYPIIILVSSILGAYLPIIFVFCDDSELIEKQFDNTYKALCLSFAISMILHFTSPQFYCEYLFEKGYIETNDLFWARYFFQGLFGVTALGTLSACASLYYLCKYVEDKKRITFFLMMLSVVTLFLTGRRSAIAAFLLGTVVVLVLDRINKGTRLSTKQFFVSIAVIVILTFIIANNYEYFSDIYDRVINVSGALSERNNNWFTNIRNMETLEYLIGTGFGTKSHTALQYGYSAVADSSFIGLFCEIGIIGSFLFLIMIIYFVSGIRIRNSNRYYLSAVLTVMVFLIQAIGSNVFEFQATAPLFWISMGYCIHYRK